MKIQELILKIQERSMVMDYVHKDEFEAFKDEVNKKLAKMHKEIEQPEQEEEPEVKEKKHRK
jgi:hypothetical protein